MATLTEADFRLLFEGNEEARTYHYFTSASVDEALLRKLYELTRLGPTGNNSQPLRLVFVKSQEAREKLRPALSPGNLDKTMNAPLTIIAAWDTEYFEKFPILSPHSPESRERIKALPEAMRESLGTQSANLQIGYLILAARGLGLGCGPMGGFKRDLVDAAFFPDGKWKSLLLINLGYGDPSKLHPRAPRLDFDEACRVV